jgi:hypothetical protein
MTTRKTDVIQIRVSPEQKAEVLAQAQTAGKTISELLLDAVGLPTTPRHPRGEKRSSAAKRGADPPAPQPPPDPPAPPPPSPQVNAPLRDESPAEAKARAKKAREALNLSRFNQTKKLR